MLKMIASDMDGTLLNNQLVIPEDNIKAIKLAQEKGVHFLVATGRSHTEARPVLEAAGINCPMITANGAQGFDTEGNNLFTIGFSEQVSRDLILKLEENDLYFEIATTEGFFSTNRSQREANSKRFLQAHQPELTPEAIDALAAQQLEHFPVQFINSFQELFHKEGVAILKFIIFGHDDLTLLEKIAEELATIGDLAITSSFKGNIEITHSDAQKGLALTKYAASLGISLEQTMALGDNFNDLSMLTRVGYSVAMGNAEPEIKAIATYETDSNDNSGVAQAIQRFLL